MALTDERTDAITMVHFEENPIYMLLTSDKIKAELEGLYTFGPIICVQSVDVRIICIMVSSRNCQVSLVQNLRNDCKLISIGAKCAS